MSAIIPNQLQSKGLSDSLSKRELKKLEKAIKLFESQENQQTKNPKRRAHSSITAIEPHQRKQVKIDANLSTSPNDQIISSPLNSSEPVSTTPQQRQTATRQLPNHLNPLYQLPTEDGDIFNYLLCYTYGEGEKKLEKQSQDWTQIDKQSHQSLTIMHNKTSAAICQTLTKKIKEVKDRLREPLGKLHRQFSQKFLKKQPLTQ